MRWPTHLCLVVVSIVSCDKASEIEQKSDSTTQASSAQVSSAPKKKEPVKAEPALDVKSLKDALGCAGKKGRACAVLNDFADCVPFKPNPSAADARWFGEGVAVSGGTVTEEFTLLRSERVAVADVAPGQFPAKVGVSKISAEKKGALFHAPKAIKAFKRGDVAREQNATIKHVKARKNWPSEFISHAGGNQAFIRVDGGVYLCARQDQRLMVVKKTGGGGDGLYATLWPVSW